MKLRILQLLLLIGTPILSIYLIGFLFTLPIALASLGFIVSSLVKEHEYKNKISEIPYFGFHLLLSRKVNSFNTINGKYYYTYHDADSNKDIIRLFKRKGIGYVLVGYEVFWRNFDRNDTKNIIKNLYHDHIEGKSKSSLYDIKIDYIGTEEEIARLKRVTKLDKLNIE